MFTTRCSKAYIDIVQCHAMPLEAEHRTRINFSYHISGYDPGQCLR